MCGLSPISKCCCYQKLHETANMNSGDTPKLAAGVPCLSQWGEKMHVFNMPRHIAHDITHGRTEVKDYRKACSWQPHLFCDLSGGPDLGPFLINLVHNVLLILFLCLEQFLHMPKPSASQSLPSWQPSNVNSKTAWNPMEDLKVCSMTIQVHS